MTQHTQQDGPSSEAGDSNISPIPTHGAGHFALAGVHDFLVISHALHVSHIARAEVVLGLQRAGMQHRLGRGAYELLRLFALPQPMERALPSGARRERVAACIHSLIHAGYLMTVADMLAMEGQYAFVTRTQSGDARASTRGAASSDD